MSGGGLLQHGRLCGHQQRAAGGHQGKGQRCNCTWANDHNISFSAAIFSSTRRIHDESLRLLFFKRYRESEDFVRLTGQLAQPNRDHVISKPLANAQLSLPASRARLHTSWPRQRRFGSLNLAPWSPALRPSARKSHAPLLHASIAYQHDFEYNLKFIGSWTPFLWCPPLDLCCAICR